MGLFRQNGFLFERVIKMMELYIETLTGTAFELRVSPYETVQDVKARIQKLEGKKQDKSAVIRVIVVSMTM